MRKLVFSALALAGLVQSSGCIIGDDDPEGFFHLSWSVTLNGAQSTCDEAGVAEVEVLVTDDVGQGTADHFPCNNGDDTTFGLEPGFYTVQVNALDAADVAIATGVAETDWEIIDGTTTELGSYELQITGGNPGPFTIDFTVDYGDVGGGANCLETGNGVAQQQINIYDVGQAQCIPVSIATPDDPTAATCELALCQESSVVQSFQLDAGSYDIEVWGLKGAVGPNPAVCYVFEGTIDVTGDGSLDFNAPFAPPTVEDKEACNATKPVHGGR